MKTECVTAVGIQLSSFLIEDSLNVSFSISSFYLVFNSNLDVNYPEDLNSIDLCHLHIHLNEETEKTAAVDKGFRTFSTHVLRETLPFMWKLKKTWL